MFKKTKIMGVINANEDSFFTDSRFNGLRAVEKIHNMIDDGADIIDIGAISSRPGSKLVSKEEEFLRLKELISLIKTHKLYDLIDFSLDSYTPLVLKHALDAGFTIINDITALSNDEVCILAASYNATVVLMHMQNSPLTMQIKPEYKNVTNDIELFFKERIKKAKKFGVKDLILDVGIGFGKTLEHNITLINNLKQFSIFPYEILIAASRKSMINDIVTSEVKDRLPGTLTIHLEAIRNGASIVRTHDVKEHFQAIRVYEALKSASLN